VVQKKIAKSLMLRHLATVCSRITRFRQNAQKLTDNIVIKYSLFGSW